MADKLLVRMFDVGLGDCIYLQVPDPNGIDGKVHILIDCGNKFGEMPTLKTAIQEVEALLPEEEVNGVVKKRLDLLVVTHPHEDHHKGFEPAYFQNIRIKNLWLSPAFRELDPDKPGEKLTGLRLMQGVVEGSLNRLIEASPAGETRDFLMDVLMSLSKSEAVAVLNGGAKEEQKLDVVKRRYVSSDFSYPGAAFTKDDFENDLKELFHDPETKIKILGPVGNFATYLPKPKQKLQGSGGPGALGAAGEESEPDGAPTAEVRAPRNISAQDFDLLRRGIQGNVLAAAAELGHAVNNLSVVLLLEWKGFRLLFPGDAEWEGSQIELKEANNGSWNVMWDTNREELSRPVDFLKVGHHGSENATPWALKGNGEAHPISVILDALLPEPGGAEPPAARAVVSTHDTTKWPSIPDPLLLAEIGKRVSNRKTYEVHLDTGMKETGSLEQPWRTDRECQGATRWIDITFPAEPQPAPAAG